MSDVLDLLGEFLSFCQTSAQMVIGFFVSASCVIAIDFQAWKTGDCMYSEVICINLLLNHWVKLGAIKSAKGSIQCLVNERIHKGWIICIQTHYELVVKTKMIIILHTIFSPCSRGMLMGVSLQGCSVVLFAVAVQPLISVTNMNWKGRAISVPHTRSVADRDFPAFLSCYLCNAHILLLQTIWMTHQQDLEPAWAKQ